MLNTTKYARKEPKKHQKVPKFYKKKTYPHCPTPLPSELIHFFENDIHIKDFFIHMLGPPIAYPHLRTPPPYPQNVDNLPVFFWNPSLSLLVML